MPFTSHQCLWLSSKLPHGAVRRCVDVMVVKNLRVPVGLYVSHLYVCKNSSQSYLHHNFPCVNGQVRIVETPIELFFRDRLICGVVVRCKVLVAQGLSGCYPRLGVKDQHALQQVHRYFRSAPHIVDGMMGTPTLLVGVLELGGQRLPLTLGQRLDEPQGLRRH